MSAFEIERTLQWVQSHAKKLGEDMTVVIGEPKSPPIIPTLAIWMMDAHVIHLYGDGGTGELHIVNARYYLNALKDAATVETAMARVMSKYLNRLLSDADLGTTIKSIDVAGMAGTPIAVKWGHVQLDQTMFRVCDITIPLLVDDSAKASP